jgi:hypothetical protein
VLKNKVFSIGFHKTGTTSLEVVLRKLGLRICGNVGKDNPYISVAARDIAFTLLEHFDAFRDNPWTVLFRDLDQACPESKFILTVRSPERWIQSVLNAFGGQSTPMREWIYEVGNPIGNETLYLRRYLKHLDDVCAYFKGQPEKLLVINVTEDPLAIDKICTFIGKAKPMDRFPWENRASYSSSPYKLDEALRLECHRVFERNKIEASLC